MISRRIGLAVGIIAATLAGIFGLLAGAFYVLQGVFVYHPTHQTAPAGLTPWLVEGQLFGYAREATTPAAVWLIMQGNAGQAGQRGYFKNVPASEAIFVLEYPGYGQRSGPMTRDSINTAAAAAYHELRRRFPDVPVGVVGESFGSGPATRLARESRPPDRFVLFVPLARLDLLMDRFVPVLPMRLLLRENWNNVASLQGYRGPVTIYAAENDQVIPRAHTLLLAQSVPAARLVWLAGGHNDAGEDGSVRLAP